MALTIDSVYRDYNTLGVPASGDYKPRKPEIRSLLKRIELSTGAGIVVRATKALLDATTPPSETSGGWVLNDPTPAFNGYYVRNGGGWTRARGFHDTFVELIDVDGTADAVTASYDSSIDPAEVAVWFIEPLLPNTGAVTLNGNPVKNVNGDALSVGEWSSGRLIMLVDRGTEWRLLSDPDVDGAVAAAAASAAAAAASEAAAEQAAIDAQAAVTFSRVAEKFTTTGVGPYDMGVGNTIGTPNNLDVKIGGVPQDHDTYTVAGTEFTFTSDPGAGLAMEAVLTSETRVLNAPAAGSVTEEALDPTLLARFGRIVTAQDFGAVFDDSVDDRARIKEAALAAAAAGVPFVVPNIGLDRSTGLVLQVPEDFATVQAAHDAMLNWIFPGARPKTVADNIPITSNHVPQIAVTISVSGGQHLLDGTNITWNHPSGDLIEVVGRDRVALTFASQQEITYSSGVHFVRLRFSTWPATAPVAGRTLRIILAPGSSSGAGAYQNFAGAWRITAVDAANKDITVAVYAKTDTSLLTATVGSGTFIYLPTLIRAINIPHSGADVGAFDVHTTLRLADVAISGNASGTNATSTNGIIAREGAKVLLGQYVAVLEFQRSGLWLLNSAYAEVGYAAFCGNNSGINNLQSVVDGTSVSVQGNVTYGYIGGIGSSGSVVVSAFGGCGTAGIVINGNAAFIGSGHSRRSQYGVLVWPGGFANINDMNVRANVTKDVKRHGGGRCLLTSNDVGTFEPALDSGDSYGGFTALTATLAAVA